LLGANPKLCSASCSQVPCRSRWHASCTQWLSMTRSVLIESPFSEDEETELAADLLATNDEHELDHFLGNLLRHAASAAGRRLRWPLLVPLGSLVKGAVRKILPTVGRRFNGLIPFGAGDAGQLAAGASQLLGMELEGMSGEDQE